VGGPAVTAEHDWGAFVPGPSCERAATGRGGLEGLRFAVKDLIDVAGARTGAGNPDWLRDQAPAARTAPVVTSLLAAGASLAGKTITDELAFSLEGVNAHYGTPVNPACADRIPGGSSSGSAVAVAAGLVDFALGTDTGGSVRVPASFVGVCGFRPSHGAIALDGVVPFAPSYDTVGWFAQDADLLARVGSVLLPPRQTPPISRLVFAADAFALADGSAASTMRVAVTAWPLAKTISVFDGGPDAWRECYRVLQGAEIWHHLGAWIAQAKPRFGAAIAPRFADAATITAAQIATSGSLRVRYAAHVCALVPTDTALIVPTAPCAALPRYAAGEVVGDFYRRALALTSIAGHSGAPQVSLPVAREQGRPLGVSLIGAPGCDRALLDLAARLARNAQEMRLA
jgi:amidase